MSNMIMPSAKKFDRRQMLIMAAVVAVVGIAVIVYTRAAGPFATLEPEAGNILAPATIGADATASNGQFVQFGSISGGGGGTITGTAYYVDCNAAGDTGNGTSEASAWKSLAKANAASLAPGDGILFKRGCTWSSSNLVVKWNGTAASPTIIGAYGTGNAPMFTRNTNGPDISVTGSYNIIQDLNLTATAPSSIASTDVTCPNAPVGNIQGVAFESGATNNTLKNTTISSMYAGVFLKSGARDNHVIGNTFTNNNMMSPLDTSSDNDAGAFGVLIWGNNNEVAYNSMTGSNACSYDYTLDGAAIEIYGGASIPTSNNHIHHNKSVNDNAFTELGKSSSAPSPDNNVYSYNSYTTSSISNAIFLVTRGSGGSFGPMTNTKMYNNTAYMTGTTKNGIYCGGTCDANTLTFKNNIIATNNNTPIPTYPANVSNNIGWVVGSGTNDPKFVNAGSRDFHLQSTSPAINSGTNETVTAGYTKDLDDHTVPTGGGVDIGAYEYGSVANNSNTLQRSIAWIDNKFSTVFDKVSDQFNGFFSSINAKWFKPSDAQAQSTGSINIATVGDMNPDNNTSTTSASGKNAAAIKAGLANGSLDYFFGLGDFQYQNATCNTLVNFWGSLWKDVIPKTYHIGGPNHDWDTSSTYNPAVPGYKEYFNGQCAGQANKSAAVMAKGAAISPIEFYSFDIGNWHFAALPTGLWRISSTQANQITAQLDADLAAAKAAGKHLGAMYHDPYFTSSTSSHNRETAVKPWVDVMDKYDVRLTLSGSQHNYERSCPVLKDDTCTPDEGAGMTAFQVSTGGIGLRSFTSSPSYIVKRFSDTHGWLKLTLNNDGSFSWLYNSVSGPGTDSGSRVAPGGSPPGDGAPPTTSITAPLNGSTVTGTTNVTAIANDNVGVTKVDFLVDGVVKASPSTSPYSYTLDSTTLSNGAHTIQTRAYDAAGSTGASAIVNITVANGCPTIPSTFGSSTMNVNVPSAGTYHVWSRVMVPDNTNNSYYFNSDSSCAVTVGDNASITPNTWVWVDYKDGITATKNDVTFSAGGSHSFTLTGREPGVKLDRVLLISDTCIPTGNGDNCTAQPDITKPASTITSPANLTASPNGTAIPQGDITVSATGSDTGGSGLAKVDFYVDGVYQHSDTTSPYSYTWNATSGAHTFRAIGVDGAGNFSDTTNDNQAKITVASSPPTCSSKQGDANNDNAVNILDISAILSTYGQTSTANCADVNKDSSINILDISLVLSRYGT